MLRQLATCTLGLAIAVSPSLATTSTSNLYPQTPRNEGQQTTPTANDNDSKQLLPRYRRLSKPQPPNHVSAGENSWLLYLQRSGGLDGTMQSQIMITSEGDVSIETGGPTDGCIRRLPDKLDELAAALKSVRLPESSGTDDGSARVSLCHDCYRTTLAVFYRGEGGLLSGYEVYWDDTTAASLVKEIYDVYKTAQKIRDTALETCRKTQ